MLDNVALSPIDSFELILWLISIAVLTIIGIFFIKDYRKAKNNYFFWISLFFLLLMVARIFRLIVIYYIGEPPIGQPFTGTAFIFESLFLFTMYIALFCIYFALERNILKKTHYIFSGLVCVLCSIAIVNLLFFNILLYVAMVLFIITILGLPLIFINLAKKTSGALRRKAFVVFIGAILAELGLAFDVPEGFILWSNLGLLDLFLILAPILQIIGYILIKKGFPRVE